MCIRDRVLGELLDGALPAATDARITAFTPEGFDLEETAAPFRDDGPERKRKLLELVVAVRDADDVFDTDEDDYMTALARALGMKPEEYADLALQIEELRSSLDEVRRSMPPAAPPRRAAHPGVGARWPPRGLRATRRSTRPPSGGR